VHDHLNIGDTFIQKPFDFLSKYSYEFFFIHYFFLFLLKGKIDLAQFGWYGVTAMLIVLTVATIGAIEKAKTIFARC
jgi:peptidoglycan/LPS O-acetylase OafA/YrhL